jgi:hypothetical protein
MLTPEVIQDHPGAVEDQFGVVEDHHGVVEDPSGVGKAHPGVLDARLAAVHGHFGSIKSCWSCRGLSWIILYDLNIIEDDSWVGRGLPRNRRISLWGR